MTGSPIPIELSDSPEATCNPFVRSYQNPTITLGETDKEISSPIRPYSNTANITNPTTIFDTATLNSDPFEIYIPRIEFSTFPYRLIYPNRKRDITPISNLTNKTCRVSQETNKLSRDLVLNTRDLIVQVYTIEKSRDE